MYTFTKIIFISLALTISSSFNMYYFGVYDETGKTKRIRIYQKTGDESRFIDSVGIPYFHIGISFSIKKDTLFIAKYFTKEIDGGVHFPYIISVYTIEQNGVRVLYESNYDLTNSLFGPRLELAIEGDTIHVHNLPYLDKYVPLTLQNVARLDSIVAAE